MTTTDEVRYRTGDAEITEEALDRLYKQVGVVRAAKPWATELASDLCKHYALYCLGSDNPLWTDETYATEHGRVGVTPAPSTEYITCSADKRLGGVGLPGIFGLHASDEWEFYRQPEVGEKIHSTVELLSIDVRDSKWGGRAVWQYVAVRFYDIEDKIVSTYLPVSVRAERKNARSEAKYVEEDAYVYSDDEIDLIKADYESEQIRGGTSRFIEDVKVGDSLGHVVKGPLTVMDLMCWWIGAGGPYVQSFKQRHLIQRQYPSLAIRDALTNAPRSPEDAHFDLEYAKRSGVGHMYDIGRQRTVSFIHLLTNWCGDDGQLTNVKVLMPRPFYVGDTSWYKGTVKDVDVATGEVTCELVATTQRGSTHSTGTATLRLPRRN